MDTFKNTFKDTFSNLFEEDLTEVSVNHRRRLDKYLDDIEGQEDGALKMQVVMAYAKDIASGKKFVTPGPGQIKVNGRPI